MIKPLVGSILVFRMWLEDSPMALNTESHCDLGARQGNSQNYWPVNSSNTWTTFRISENSKKYQITLKGLFLDVDV